MNAFEYLVRVLVSYRLRIEAKTAQEARVEAVTGLKHLCGACRLKQDVEQLEKRLEELSSER